MPLVFSDTYMHRDNIFLDLFFYINGAAQSAMARRAFVEGFLDYLINVRRNGACETNMTDFLSGAFPAFLWSVWFREPK